MPESQAQEAAKSRSAPKRLLPTHIGNEPELRGREREKALYDAPDFEKQMHKLLTDRGEEPSDKVNYSLMAIEELRDNVKTVQALRKAIRAIDEKISTKDPEAWEKMMGEKRQMLRLYTERKGEVDEFLSYGLSAEAAYREYIKARLQFVKFKSTLSRLNELENLQLSSSFSTLPADAKLDERDYAFIEGRMRAFSSQGQTGLQDENSSLEALATIYGEDSPEYRNLKKAILEGVQESEALTDDSLPKTKKEAEEMIKNLKEEARSLWEDEMVRYFWHRSEMEEMALSFAQGEEVEENQEVIRQLNTLHRWELQHSNSTVGGILVGPPGVGKTTLLRHYLETKDRKYAYVDLSKDVTRYMLLGSKQIELKSTSESYKDLVDSLSGMTRDDFKKFIEDNTGRISQAMSLNGEDAMVVSIDMLNEALGDAVSEGVPVDRVAEVKEKVVKFAQEAYNRELATEFAHLTKKNGWRDGVLVYALRNDMSVILDEFVQNKDWSVIYSLMTAKPGGEWFFADNNETIKVPDNWKMFFTANIGKRYGSFAVPEAMASRAAGQVMEVGYPQFKTEFEFGLIALSDANLRFLRSKEDLGKLYVLIGSVIGGADTKEGLRKYIEDKHQAIPFSYRTIRNLAEKLVLYKDPKTRKPLYQPTQTTFDEALYEVLIDSYALFEDKTVPREIVNHCTSCGLLLDDSVKDRVIGWIGEAEYQSRKAEEPKHKKSYEEIVKEIRSMGTTIDVGDISQRSY